MAGRVTPLADWLAQRTEGAPEVLRARVDAWVSAVPETADEVEQVAVAGRTALGAAVGQSGDRSVALDLLAADALVTLALLHQAEHDAAGLEALARQIRLPGDDARD